MPEYHITPLGKIKPCIWIERKQKCFYGSDEEDNPHFDSIQEAEEYRNKRMKKQEEQEGLLPMFIFSNAKEKEERNKILDEIEDVMLDIKEKIATLKRKESEKIEAIASKMGRWHITPAGRVQPCISEIDCCPYGLEKDNPHFKTKQEAEKYRDENKEIKENLPMFILNN